MAAIEEVIAAIAELLEVDQITVHLHDPREGGLRLVAHRGFDAGGLEHLRGAGGEPSPWERAFQRRTGTTVEDLSGDGGLRVLQSRLLSNAQGEPCGLLSVYRPEPRQLTERDLMLFKVFARQVEQVALVDVALPAAPARSDEAGLREALDAGQVGTFSWDIRTGDIRWSDNLELIHGMPPGTFGRTFQAYQELIHPEDRERVLEQIRAAVESRGDYEAEFRCADTSNGVRWVMGRGKVFAGEHGEPARMTGVCKDITKRKRAEQALLEANQRKDELLAMVSHELRNPLAAIMNASALLNHVNAGEQIWSKACVVIEHQTEQLVRIVDDLLDVSRLAAGKLTLESTYLDLGALAERCAQDFVARRMLDSHRHEVRCQVTPVQGDGPRLEQIVSNLLTNAIKYTPPGGKIIVEVVPRDDEAVLRVTDTGIGIPPDLLPRIFDLFVQSERGRERRDGGLGLGLAIVRRLAEAHGGRAEARSAGPNTGAEITIRLPLAGTPAAADAAARHVTGTPGRHRILLIDDNTDAREAVAALLEISGHEVFQASDAPHAFEVAGRVRPDVAIVDIGLPGVDGFEVARRLRSSAPSMRLIALTGYGESDHRRLGAAAGFESYLVKPVGLDALLRTLASR